MEYGIIVACLSLFGTFALVLADATADVDAPVTANEGSARDDNGLRQAA